MRRSLSQFCLSACFLAGLASAGPAFGQSIEVDELGSATPFQAGAQDQGQTALGQSLWQGTNAGLALALLDRLPVEPQSDTARDMIRAALLSAGVPPRAENEAQTNAYTEARYDAIIAIGDLRAAQNILSRASTATGRLEADLALLAGDTSRACLVSDGVSSGRSEPYWASLRAFCHVLRDENAAAEITLDILRSSEFEDPAYFNLMEYLIGVPGAPNIRGIDQTPIHIALMNEATLDWPAGRRPAVAAARLALSPVAAPEDRQNALFEAGFALSDAQITQVLEDLAETGTSESLADQPMIGETINGIVMDPATRRVDFSLDSALAADGPARLGKLYQVSQYGDQTEQTAAIAALLGEAQTAGSFYRFAKFFAPQIQVLPQNIKIQTDLSLFIRSAILERDISFLQRAFQSSGEQPEIQSRIALAADSVGNGFYGGELGTDIETRLSGAGAEKTRAMRDALLAAAMGARLSDKAVSELESQNNQTVSGQLIALQSAAQKQAKAEIALRAALMLEDGSQALSDYELFVLVSALQTTGLSDYAGRIAAEDYLQGSIL